MNSTFRTAERFGVNRIAAARIRARFLQESIQVYLEDGSELALQWAWEAIDELLYLFKHAGYSEVKREDRKQNQITDEMKQRALDYPITSLIEFRANKAMAFCHADKTPSLTYFAKNNKCWCPVCNKAFNSIDIVMYQEECSYFEAIRSLCD